MSSVAIKAVRWSGISTLVRAALQFFQLIVLARVLERSDVGVAVLFFSFLTVAQVFSDVGLNNYLLNRNDLKAEELEGVYGLSLIVGLFLFLLSVFFGWIGVRLYGDERLFLLATAVGATFFVNSLWMQKKTLLEKAFKFAFLAKAEIASSLFPFLLMCFLAIGTGSVYSVIAFPLGYSVLMAIFVVFLSDSGRGIKFSLKYSSWKECLSYSANNFGFSFVNSLTSQADVFFGARFLGATGIGMYGLSKDLCLKASFIVNNAASRVSLPLMSAADKDPVKLQRIYQRVVSLITAFNFPVYVFPLFFSHETVKVVFGDKWVGDVGVFSMLLAWGMLRSLGQPSGGLVFVAGEASRGFRFSIFSALVFLPSFWIGAQYDAFGLALAALIALSVQQVFLVWGYLVRPYTGLSLGAYLNQPARSLFSACMAGCCVKFLLDSSFLAINLIVYFCAYFFLSYWLNKSVFEDVVQLAGLKKIKK